MDNCSTQCWFCTSKTAKFFKFCFFISTNGKIQKILLLLQRKVNDYLTITALIPTLPSIYNDKKNKQK